MAKEFEQGDETLTDLKIGDKNGIDTSTLETEASYEGTINKTYTQEEADQLKSSVEEQNQAFDDFDAELEELMQGGGGDSDDTTNDIAYKNGG